MPPKKNKPTFHCQNCSKSYKSQSTLNRHQRDFHKILDKTTSFRCDDCNSVFGNLADVTSHSEETHRKSVIKLCIYCNVTFSSLQRFSTHVQNEHGLPSSGFIQPEVQPSSSSCSAALKIYELPVDNSEADLLQYMLTQKSTIYDVILQNVKNFSYKVQFSAIISLVKPDGPEEKQIDVFLNTYMMPVFFDGLSDEQFLDMVQQMISTLNVFATYGSGWIVQKIKKVVVNMGKFSPIRGSRYISLPPELDNEQSLLNIRNMGDNNCFLHCFIAQYHLTFGPSLHPPRATKRQKEDPWYYSSGNPIAHVPQGTFTMPMSLNQIHRFEELNDVSVNVFR